MKTGFIYWHPIIYHSLMHMLYGRNIRARYEAIASLLPDGICVVDVCSGDCYITTFLTGKRIDYLGLDLNPRFIKYALKKGIKAELFDVRNSSIPQADYIIIHGSLYQFIPEHRLIIDRIFSSARKAVIISEPVRNVASCGSSVISFLADMATKVDGKSFLHRFSKEELLNLFNEYNVSKIKEIQGGRELIGLFILDRRP